MVANTNMRARSQRKRDHRRALMDILSEAKQAGEKVLVFANRRLLHRWLEHQISDEFGVQVQTINGQVTGSKRRMKIIERFSKAPGFQVLVLAPRAAGVGLNITAANHVVHYTREWNPAIEEQATARAYRMGQTRNVHVHYIITQSASGSGTTVEERLDGLLRDKRALSDDFVVPMGAFQVKTKDFKLA